MENIVETTATTTSLTSGVSTSMLGEMWTSVSPMSGLGMRSSTYKSTWGAPRVCSPVTSKLESIVGDVLGGESVAEREAGCRGRAREVVADLSRNQPAFNHSAISLCI